MRVLRQGSAGLQLGTSLLVVIIGSQTGGVLRQSGAIMLTVRPAHASLAMCEQVDPDFVQ